jgi:hypothetical protein
MPVAGCWIFDALVEMEWIKNPQMNFLEIGFTLICIAQDYNLAKRSHPHGGINQRQQGVDFPKNPFRL